MIEEDRPNQGLNKTDFLKITKAKSQDVVNNHTNSGQIDFSDGEIEIDFEKSSKTTNSSSKTISPNSFPQLKKMKESDDIPTLDHKRFTSLKASPSNTKNKMPLQRTRQMSIGNTINRNNFQKVSIYGKKIHIGLGFPTKVPVIKNTESEIIEKSEKTFKTLENLIQKLKDESKTLNLKQTLTESEEKSINSQSSFNDIKNSQYINDKNLEYKDNNLCKSKKDNFIITAQDITLVTNEMDSTKQKFIRMEEDILDDFSNINSSIDKLLEDRKEMQKQHRIWLENMKKQINKTKLNTRCIDTFR